MKTRRSFLIVLLLTAVLILTLLAATPPQPSANLKSFFPSSPLLPNLAMDNLPLYVKVILECIDYSLI